MYKYVSMDGCMYVCMYVCIIYKYVCMYLCAYVCVCMYVSANFCTYIRYSNTKIQTIYLKIGLHSLISKAINTAIYIVYAY